LAWRNSSGHRLTAGKGVILGQENQGILCSERELLIIQEA